MSMLATVLGDESIRAAAQAAHASLCTPAPHCASAPQSQECEEDSRLHTEPRGCAGELHRALHVSRPCTPPREQAGGGDRQPDQEGGPPVPGSDCPAPPRLCPSGSGEAWAWTWAWVLGHASLGVRSPLCKSFGGRNFGKSMLQARAPCATAATVPHGQMLAWDIWCCSNCNHGLGWLGWLCCTWLAAAGQCRPARVFVLRITWGGPQFCVKSWRDGSEPVLACLSVPVRAVPSCRSAQVNSRSCFFTPHRCLVEPLDTRATPSPALVGKPVTLPCHILIHALPPATLADGGSGPMLQLLGLITADPLSGHALHAKHEAAQSWWPYRPPSSLQCGARCDHPCKSLSSCSYMYSCHVSPQQL